MKLDLGELFGRHVPLALIGALMLHGATVIWWVSARDRDSFFLQQRVATLENSASRANETQMQMLERLARIEERVYAQSDVLDRIERQTAARK